MDSVLRSKILSYELGSLHMTLIFKDQQLLIAGLQGGGISLFDYNADEIMSTLTVSNLQTFVETIKQKTGVNKFHVIAHSMGNRPLTSMLVGLKNKHHKRIFNQVILAAPDIDIEEFEKIIAPKILGTSERITLYASSNDNVLDYAKKYKGDRQRVGNTKPKVFVTNGIDTIDTSETNDNWLSDFHPGHSYYGDELIQDMFFLIKYGFSPEKRNLIPITNRADPNATPYWKWAN